VKHTRISAAEIVRAKVEAEKAGLRLRGLEKRPDGTVKLEFAEPDESNGDGWFAGGPLYNGAE
jgi:hypothetical protein